MGNIVEGAGAMHRTDDAETHSRRSARASSRGSTIKALAGSESDVRCKWIVKSQRRDTSVKWVEIDRVSYKAALDCWMDGEEDVDDYCSFMRRTTMNRLAPL